MGLTRSEAASSRRPPGSTTSRRTGILGGAFDPPHLGHLALARGGVAHFELERLLVCVVARPGHKGVQAPADARLELARLAFRELDQAEVALDPHARTVDSLEALALDDPVFLIGGDELADFPTWKEPDRVLDLARLGVGLRPGTDRAELDAVLAALSRPDRVEVFPIEQHDVSSSELRFRAARGESLDGLVPPRVAAEIVQRGLYRAT
jgi:nicotinate-nucleotide adenylyltransferase